MKVEQMRVSAPDVEMGSKEAMFSALGFMN